MELGCRVGWHEAPGSLCGSHKHLCMGCQDGSSSGRWEEYRLVAAPWRRSPRTSHHGDSCIVPGCGCGSLVDLQLATRSGCASGARCHQGNAAAAAIAAAGAAVATTGERGQPSVRPAPRRSGGSTQAAAAAAAATAEQSHMINMLLAEVRHRCRSHCSGIPVSRGPACAPVAHAAAACSPPRPPTHTHLSNTHTRTLKRRALHLVTNPSPRTRRWRACCGSASS
jgi:hypothetical protein